MNYYCISYLYSEEEHGIYQHLPVTSQVTNDLATALKWFDDAVKAACKSWNGNELVSIKDRELDYMCYLKQAHFVCNEAAYMKGHYLIELGCYTHNPCV